LGPSGSGKSTFLNLIGVLDIPTSGYVKIDGVDVSKLGREKQAKIRQKIGFVFQYYNLIPRFNAFQNIEIAMSLQNISQEQREKRVLEITKLVGLQSRLTHKPNQLSGGQQQRVAIARALVQKPKFLLMDEPTGNLDSKSRDELLTLVKKLNKTDKVTVVMITHDPEIAKITDRTLYLIDGEFSKDYNPTTPVILYNESKKHKKENLSKRGE
jgi:putative ABC transport system ATP-binding protein